MTSQVAWQWFIEISQGFIIPLGTATMIILTAILKRLIVQDGRILTLEEWRRNHQSEDERQHEAIQREMGFLRAACPFPTGGCNHGPRAID